MKTQIAKKPKKWVFYRCGTTVTQIKVVKEAFGHKRYFYAKGLPDADDGAVLCGDWYRIVDCPGL